MKIRFSKSFDQEYQKLTKHNLSLQRKILKQLEILKRNPNHPSLRLHKLNSSVYWSIAIDKSIRILIIMKEYIVLCHIGKHEDIYN